MYQTQQESNYNNFDASLFQRTEAKLLEIQPLAIQFQNISKIITSTSASQDDRLKAHLQAETLSTQVEPLLVWRSIMRFIPAVSNSGAVEASEVHSFASQWLKFHLKKRWESIPHLLILQNILLDIYDMCGSLPKHTVSIVGNIVSELWVKVFLDSSTISNNESILELLNSFLSSDPTNSITAHRVQFALTVLYEVVSFINGRLNEEEEDLITSNTVSSLKFRDIESFNILKKSLNILCSFDETNINPDTALLAMNVAMQCFNIDEDSELIQTPVRYHSLLRYIRTDVIPFVLNLFLFTLRQEQVAIMQKITSKMTKTSKILQFLTVIVSCEGIFGVDAIDSQSVFAFLSIIYHILEKWKDEAIPCLLHEQDLLEEFTKFLARFSANVSLGHALSLLPNEISSIWSSLLKFISYLYLDGSNPEVAIFHNSNNCRHSNFRPCGVRLFFSSASPRHLLTFLLHVLKSCEQVGDTNLRPMISSTINQYLQTFVAFLTPDSRYLPNNIQQWIDDIPLDESWHDELQRTAHLLGDLLNSDPGFGIQVFYNLLSQYATSPNLLTEIKLTFLVYVFSRVLEVNLCANLSSNSLAQETTVLALSYLIALTFFIFKRQQDLAASNAVYSTTEQFPFLRIALLHYFIIMCGADAIQTRRPTTETVQLDPNFSKFTDLYDRVSEYLSKTLGSHFAGRNRTNLSENMIKVSMQIFEYWSSNDYLMRENISFLKQFADSDWRNMDIFAKTVMNHLDTFLNSNRFPFLNPLNLLRENMESGDIFHFHKTLRRQFYTLIGRTIFHGYRTTNNLPNKISELDKIDAFFNNHFSFHQFESAFTKDPAITASLIGLCVNLRGIIESITDEASFSVIFDWFFPKQFQILSGLFFTWNQIPNSSDVIIAILRLLIEVTDDKREARIRFKPNSPNGLLFFRGICDVISRYGDYHLSGNNAINYPPDSMERELFKPRGVILKLLGTLLNQNYLPFGALYIGTSDRLFSMEHVINSVFRLVKSLKDMHQTEKFLVVFPKVTAQYLRCLEVLCFSHTPILATLLTPADFQDILEDLADAFAYGSTNAKLATSCLDCLLCEIIKYMWLCDRERCGYHEDEVSGSVSRCRCAKCTMEKFSVLFQNENVVISFQGLIQQLFDLLMLEVMKKNDLLSLVHPVLPLSLLLPQLVTIDIMRTSAVTNRHLRSTQEFENLLMSSFNFFQTLRSDRTRWYVVCADDSDNNDWNNFVLSFRQQYFAMKEAMSISLISKS